jgi:hypothetical protein
VCVSERLIRPHVFSKPPGDLDTCPCLRRERCTFLCSLKPRQSGRYPGPRSLLDPAGKRRGGAEERTWGLRVRHVRGDVVVAQRRTRRRRECSKSGAFALVATASP